MEEYTISIDKDTLAFYTGLGYILKKPCDEVISEILVKTADSLTLKFTQAIGGAEETIVYYDTQKKHF